VEEDVLDRRIGGRQRRGPRDRAEAGVRRELADLRAVAGDDDVRQELRIARVVERVLD
jgi:hypothetical protein